MNRREFLHRLAAIGCVAATPKLIFDMGKNTYRPGLSKFTYYEGAQGLYLDPMHNFTWKWITPDGFVPTASPLEVIKVKGNMNIRCMPEAIYSEIIER